jgi:hypothetical protein
MKPKFIVGICAACLAVGWFCGSFWVNRSRYQFYRQGSDVVVFNPRTGEIAWRGEGSKLKWIREQPFKPAGRAPVKKRVNDNDRWEYLPPDTASPPAELAEMIGNLYSNMPPGSVLEITPHPASSKPQSR